MDIGITGAERIGGLLISTLSDHARAAIQKMDLRTNAYNRACTGRDWLDRNGPPIGDCK